MHPTDGMVLKDPSCRASPNHAQLVALIVFALVCKLSKVGCLFFNFWMIKTVSRLHGDETKLEYKYTLPEQSPACKRSHAQPAPRSIYDILHMQVQQLQHVATNI